MGKKILVAEGANVVSVLQQFYFPISNLPAAS
jgi:hypothetical protein